MGLFQDLKNRINARKQNKVVDPNYNPAEDPNMEIDMDNIFNGDGKHPYKPIKPKDDTLKRIFGEQSTDSNKELGE